MAYQIIKQPNGKLCLFSTNKETITHFNCTPENIIEVLVEAEKQIITESVTSIIEKLNTDKKPYLQFTKTYDDALNIISEAHGKGEAKKLKQLIEGVPAQTQPDAAVKQPAQNTSEQYPDTEFVQLLRSMKKGATVPFFKLTWEELFNLMYPAGCIKNYKLKWLKNDYKIHCHTKVDLPVKKLDHSFIIPAGTKVLFWMASRMGWVGICHNLINPTGYDYCVPEAEVEATLENWTVERVKETNRDL